VKDVERGLTLKLRIEHYTSNRETKDFIVEQAHRMAPEVREKSGVWYRLNRWREEQITSGKHPTYRDLVRQYIALNKMERFEKIPHARYINFVAEFLAAERRVTRAEAIAAWTELKRLDVPKDYTSWSRRERSATSNPHRVPRVDQCGTPRRQPTGSHDHHQEHGNRRTSVTGSWGATPNSSVRAKRLLAAAPTMPIVPPAAARTSDSITIDFATRRGDAPSAIRSAISRRRCTTV
jgi:hypothetical protein